MSRNYKLQRWLSVAVAFSVVAGSGGQAAELDAVEKAIVKSVNQSVVQALRDLEEVVNLNSGTMNFDGVRQVGDFFRSRLDGLGFETRWVDGASFGRAGHLVAEHKGSGSGPALLLIGHLDTVFEPDSPFQRYEALNDSIVRGPGIADMKGGDVIIIQALAALQAAGVLDKMNVRVFMTGDEERSGHPLSLARKALIEAAEAADIAIGFENGDGDPATAIVARRGATQWKLLVSGTSAHSSQVFQERVGAGAIYEASRILTGFYERLATQEYLTFNPGVILGGTDVEFDSTQARGSPFGKTNVVAQTAVVAGDLRTISLQQLRDAKAAMQAVVTEHLPKTGAKLVFRDGYPPLSPTEGNYKLLGLLDAVSRDLGQGPVTPVDPNRAGAADISFTAGYVRMALDGLGLGGADDHTVRETGNVRTLSIQAKRAAILMHRLHRAAH